MRNKISIIIALILWANVSLLVAAENVAQEANLTAPQLMELIVGDYSGLEAKYAESRKSCDRLLVRVDDLSRIGNIDARIVEMLKLMDDIRAVQQQVRQVDAVKNVALNNIVMLRRSSGATAADLNTVMKYEQDMQAWSGNVGRARDALDGHLNTIMKSLASLPPPAFFVNQCGIRFILVSPKRGRGFYVSSTPITCEQYANVMKCLRRPVECNCADSGFWTNMTYGQAVSFAADLSALERREYVLLNAKHLKMLESLENKPSIAVWLANKLTADFREQQQMKTFGINVVEVWDPNSALRDNGGNEIVGELPFAHYEALGCYVVTSDLNGKYIYFEQLKRQDTMTGEELASREDDNEE